MPKSVDPVSKAYFKQIYAKDKEKLETLIRQGVSPKEARQQAYAHQYKYFKTPAGKATAKRSYEKRRNNETMVQRQARNDQRRLRYHARKYREILEKQNFIAALSPDEIQELIEEETTTTEALSSPETEAPVLLTKAPVLLDRSSLNGKITPRFMFSNSDPSLGNYLDEDSSTEAPIFGSETESC